MAGDKADFTVRLIDRVSGAAKSAGSALGSLGKALGGTAKAAGGADQAVGGFGSTVASFAAGSLLAHGVELAAEAFVELGKEVIETTAHLVEFGQSSEFAFNQLAKHGATGGKIFEHARALAERFGIDVEDTTHQYEKFLALQFSPKAVDGLIRAGADMKALGNSAEDVRGIFLSLGEIKSIGTLQGRQLLMLEQHGVSGQLVREAIGERLGGKTVEEVNALMHKGKISAELGIQGIEDAIAKKLQEGHLGEAGAKFADTTIDGITGKFKAFSEGKGLDVTKQLEKPLTDLAGRGFDKLSAFADSPDGKKAIGELSDALRGMLDLVVDLGTSFGSGFGDTFTAIYEGAKPFIDLFTGGDSKQLIPVLELFAKDLGKIAAFGVAIGAGIGIAAAGLMEFGLVAFEVGLGIVKGITDPLFKMVGDVVLWWDNLTAIWHAKGLSLVDKVFEIGRNIIQGFGNGLASLIDLIPNMLDGIADNSIAALKKTLGIHSPSAVTFALGEHTGTGLSMGIESTGAEIAAASRGVALASVGAMSDVMSTQPAWSIGKTWGTLGSSSVDEGRASKPVDYGSIGVSSAVAPMPMGDARGSRGDVTFAPVLNVNVDGGRGDPQDTADTVGNEVDRRMEAWFRQLEMEG